MGQPSGAPPSSAQQKEYPSPSAVGAGGTQQQHSYPPPAGSFQPDKLPCPPSAPGGQGKGVMQGDKNLFRQSLEQCIREKNLQNMPAFRDPSYITNVARTAGPKVESLCQSWQIPLEVGKDIVRLALFDIVIYVDDSGSMLPKGGKRARDMMRVLSRAAAAATLFDPDGVTVRFINSNAQGDNIRSEDDVNRLIESVDFRGRTPIGTELRRKILEPLVLSRARQGQMQVPVLIITITDGEPAGEDDDTIFRSIKAAADELSRTPLGAGAIAYQFAQVGDDEGARRFLNQLDNDPQVGSLVDVTASLEIEQEEMTRVNPSQALTADFWTLKLLLGAIDASWDEADEKPGQRQGGVPPSSQGSAYPQQGGPEGSYGRGYNQGYALPGAGIYGRPGGYGQPQQQLAYGQPPAGYQGGGGGYQGGAPQTYPVGPPARGQGWAGAGAPYGSAYHGKLK
ncbi:hypothetical protein F5883DRAFT_29282 [Diaporthe sp. PMI_573]|nr:hypothetical protein F5883DRAFT_29282 [Diaporthaceae sp. PMI_573]